MRRLACLVLVLATVKTGFAFPSAAVLKERPLPPNKKWVVALQDGTPDEQIQAAEAILVQGSKASAMIPAMIQAFKNSNQPRVQMQLARSLASMGPLAKEALPLLHREFKASAGYGARDYAYAIVEIGDGSETDVLRWFLLNNSEGRSKSTTSARLCVEKHPTKVLPALGDMLRDADTNFAYRILRALRVGVLPRDSKTPAPIAALTETQRQQIITQLRQYYTAPDSRGNNATSYYQAASIALRMDPGTYQDVIPHYIAWARYTTIDRADFQCLLDAHPDAPLLLLSYFMEPSPTFRHNLMASFRDLNSPTIIQAFIAGLKHHHPLVREGTLGILRYRQLSQELKQPVLRLLDDPSPKLRLMTATHLNDTAEGDTGDASTLPALTGLIQQKDRTIRNGALREIVRLRKKSHDALPILMRLVHHSDVETRFLAADALMHIDRTNAPSCVKAFIAMATNDKHPDHIERAVIRLGDCGPLAKAALPTLRQLSDTHTARVHAAYSMWRIDPSCIEESLDLMSKSLIVIDSEPLTAMEYLPKMGAPARRMVPKLLELMISAAEEDDEISSKAAAVAIMLDAKEAEPAYNFFRGRLASPAGSMAIWFERLQELGPLVKPLLPEIIVGTQSKRVGMRRNAFNTLGALGIHAKDALPALREAAKVEGNATIANEVIKKIEAAR